jgi:hypothetical protein
MQECEYGFIEHKTQYKDAGRKVKERWGMTKTFQNEIAWHKQYLSFPLHGFPGVLRPPFV